MNFRRRPTFGSSIPGASRLVRKVGLFFLVCLVAGYVASPLAADEGTYVGESAHSSIGLPSIAAEPADLSAQSVVGPTRTREILTAFYEATDGDNWTTKTNWLSDKSVRS